MRRLSRITLLGAAVTVAAAASAAPAGAVVQVSQSGWAWGNPQPQGNTLRALEFAGGRGYAVGDAGTGLRTDDGGATWTGLPTGTAANLGRVQVVNPDVVVVLGGDGCVVRRSDDGGKTFRKVYVLTEIQCPEPVQAAYFVTPDVGYLALRNGYVLRTTDGGKTFSRQTAIPGTAESSGGGSAVPGDIHFTSPDTGIVFMAGTNTAYRTTDQGRSWQPEPDVEGGRVSRVEFVSADVAYAMGEDTLLRSTDGGQSWQRRGIGNGQNITGISCSSPDVCLLTIASGDRLLRTTDGGESAASITAATQKLFAAGFASPSRAVAVGAGGATVVSDDAGQNYTPVGGDISGSFQFGLRLGPVADTAYALGARGQLARTTNAGASWNALSVASSADLQDVSFSSGDVGYVLDVRGGLFLTTNAGESWQPLDPGTDPGSPAQSVLTVGDKTVLLAGPRTIRRQVEGGRFDPVRGRAFRRKLGGVDQFDRAGSAIVAYGTTRAVMSKNGGRTWRSVAFPKVKRGKKRFSRRAQDVDFVSPTKGFVLDITGRLWQTRNGGRRWHELAALGTNAGLAVNFPTASHGFVTLSEFPAGPGASYVLHTTDGGRTWRPQRIASGTFPGTEGVIAPTTSRAYALTSTPSAGNDVFRSLFTTSSGGDAGAPTILSLRTAKTRISKRALQRQGNRIRVTGTLSGAQGGEPIVVSAREGNGSWRSQVVTAGANGGSFTASFSIKKSARFVATWPGDSGRRGDGAPVVSVRVR